MEIFRLQVEKETLNFAEALRALEIEVSTASNLKNCRVTKKIF